MSIFHPRRRMRIIMGILFVGQRGQAQLKLQWRGRAGCLVEGGEEHRGCAGGEGVKPGSSSAVFITNWDSMYACPTLEPCLPSFPFSFRSLSLSHSLSLARALSVCLCVLSVCVSCTTTSLPLHTKSALQCLCSLTAGELLFGAPPFA